MNMLVSGISMKDGEKIAYIMFEEGDCRAEGNIPSCKITSNKGFSGEEVAQLENYMRENLSMLKKQAAAINPITAIMKSEDE